MVSGGGVLLGTCGGDKGSVGGSAGGEVSRAVARLQRRAPTRAVALRRSALGNWRGVVGRGRARRRFFELLKSCLQKLMLAVSTTAAAALAPAVRPAVARRDASVVLALMSTLTAIYGCLISGDGEAGPLAFTCCRKRRSLLVADVVFDRLAA